MSNQKCTFQANIIRKMNNLFTQTNKHFLNQRHESKQKMQQKCFCEWLLNVADKELIKLGTYKQRSKIFMLKINNFFYLFSDFQCVGIDE